MSGISTSFAPLFATIWLSISVTRYRLAHPLSIPPHLQVALANLDYRAGAFPVAERMAPSS